MENNNISDFIVYNGGDDDKNKKQMNMLIVGAIALVVVITILVVANRSFIAKPLRVKYVDRLVSSENSRPDPLGDAGWELHVANCPFCEKQKEILKKYFPNFKNIYSGVRPTNVVPFWYNKKTGQEIPGLQNLDSLNKMTKS